MCGWVRASVCACMCGWGLRAWYSKMYLLSQSQLIILTLCHGEQEITTLTKTSKL